MMLIGPDHGITCKTDPVARVDLADEELNEATRTQVKMLLRACDAFDGGHTEEHLNIATRLRVLLHHNPARNSIALLHRLGLHDQSWWVASGGDTIDENVLPEHKLLRLGALGSSKTSWEPRLGEFGATPPLPWQAQVRRRAYGIPMPRPGGRGRAFEDWWNQTVIRDASRVEFSRWDLIRVVSNQDGGAHVDPRLDEAHYRLTRQNSLGVSTGGVPRDSPIPASLRQIGWELHLTLYEHLPSLLPHGQSPPYGLGDGSSRSSNPPEMA